MAIPSSQLKALVEQQNMSPLDADPTFLEDEMGEEDEEISSGRTIEEIMESLGQFGVELESTADILCSMATEVGDSLLADEMEDDSVLAEVVDRMPPQICEGLAEQVYPLAKEDCATLADYLVTMGHTIDEDMEECSPELLCGLLMHASNYCNSPEDDDEDMDEDDEMVEDVESIPEEMME